MPVGGSTGRSYSTLHQSWLWVLWYYLVFKGLRQLMDTGLKKPRVNTFEVMGCG